MCVYRKVGENGIFVEHQVFALYGALKGRSDSSRYCVYATQQDHLRMGFHPIRIILPTIRDIRRQSACVYAEKLMKMGFLSIVNFLPSKVLELVTTLAG